MGTEGEFRYSNGGVINYKINSDRKGLVSVHEAQHGELYTATTFGQLSVMMEKNGMFHNKSKWIYKELFNYMNRMQERICVNIEHLYVYKKEGEFAYKQAIENLKTKNSTYYNYFRKLCCVNGRVSTEEEAELAINIIRKIGNIALNVNIDEIPFEDMEDSKDLQRFLSVEGNAEKYIPNVRFDIIIDCIFRNNYNAERLSLVINNCIRDEDNNFEGIHRIAEEKAKKILKDSEIYERLVERIATVGKLKLEVKCSNIEYLMNLPLDLDRKEKIEHVLMPINDFIYKIKLDKYKKSPVFLQHSMGGFENIQVITLFDIEEKKMYSTNVFCNDVFGNDVFYGVLKQIDQHIVFIQTKLFRRMKSQIRGIVRQLPVFICLENSIYYGIDFISKNFKDGFFSFIHKDKYDVLIVWRGSYIFIGYIIELARKELEMIFSEYNMKYIPYEEAEVEKEYIETVANNHMEMMILSKNYLDYLKNN